MSGMIEQVTRIPRRRFPLAAIGTIFAGCLALPNAADARVWFGFGFPFPFIVGPPAYYYPPPAYYYPPPPYYAPPAYYYRAPYPSYAAPYGAPAPQYTPSSQSCVTSGAVCPMEHPVASGSACYCGTGQGRIWGRAT
jgi:hypothetical protein